MPSKALEALTESMFYVLMALENRPMCGIEIVDFIDTKTKQRVQIGPATLYTILGKFEKEAYIREVEVVGRKRTYSITSKGTAAYQAEYMRLRCCVADAENISLEGGVYDRTERETGESAPARAVLDVRY